MRYISLNTNDLLFAAIVPKTAGYRQLCYQFRLQSLIYIYDLNLGRLETWLAATAATAHLSVRLDRLHGFGTRKSSFPRQQQTGNPVSMENRVGFWT